MKTLLISILALFWAFGTISAQSAPTVSNVEITLTPTDSLGLFLPGYGILPVVEFSVTDTIGLSGIGLNMGPSQYDSSIVSVVIPYQSEKNYYSQGMTVIRNSTHFWISLSEVAYEPELHVSVKSIHASGMQSAVATGSVQISN